MRIPDEVLELSVCDTVYIQIERSNISAVQSIG